MNTVIFDLDGTLLPMDLEVFMEVYFGAMSKKMTSYGMEPMGFMKSIMLGIEAMVNNDGSMTNEACFWEFFTGIYGEDSRKLESVFLDFYGNEFNEARVATITHPLVAKIIQMLQEKGYTIVLATNPLFPPAATYNRIGWAGLKAEDFSWITTYDNSSYCKPRLEYYKEILGVIKKKPEECLMVGNDVGEDMIAAKLGLDTYLLKENLINRKDEDITSFKQGDMSHLYDYIMDLPKL